MKTIFTFFLSIIFLGSYSQTHLVMSQVYGGGGNTGAQYTNDFVEIFNPTSSAIIMTNWSLQYASASGTFVNTNSVAISGTIQPGKYFLVQLAAGAGTPGALPTPDAIPTLNLAGTAGTINMSATTGKIALASSTTILGTGGTGCPTGAVVDFVGYGTANCSEGSLAPAPSNSLALLRASSGCQDNDNNSLDFTTAAPAPRNSSTAAHTCIITTPTIFASPGSLILTGTVGSPSASQSFTASAINLVTPDGVLVTPSAGLEVSLDGINFLPGLFLTVTAGTLANTIVYVRITSGAAQGALNGTITLTQNSAPSTTVAVTGGNSQIYYTKAAGNIDALSTYGTATDGSGTAPTDFTLPYQTFIVTQTNATIGANLDIPGTGAKLVVGNGTTATNLTIPATFAISAATKVDVSNLGTLVILNNTRPFLNTLADGSTVNFAETGITTADTIKLPAVSFFNLKLTNGLKYFPGNTTTIRGDLTVDGAKGLNGPNVTPFATINAFGNVSYINGAAFDANPAGDAGRLTLKMNGAGAIQTLNGAGLNLLLFRLERDSTSASNIVVTPGTSMTLGNASSGGLLLTPANSVLSTGSGTITLTGGGLFTTTALGKMNPVGTNLTIAKSAGTANAGIMRFVSGSSLNNLIINFDPAFARDSVFVNDSVTINGTLTLTKGKLLTNTPAVIAMGPEAFSNGGSVASYIDGKITKFGTQPFTFAVGKAGKFAPVQISNIYSLATFAVQYFNSGYGTYTINPATLSTFPYYNVSTREYWTVDRTVGTASATLVFAYDTASHVTNPALLRMAHWGGSDWNDIGGVPAGTTTSGTVTVSGVNTFSPFTFGAPVFGVLPLRLTSFTAQKSNSSVKIAWSTAQELNTSYFIIERSGDGNTWTSIGTINALGLANGNDYLSTDNSPLKGINYYRLKQVDIDGRFTYSVIRIVSFTKDAFVIITPNPARDVISVNLVKNNSNSITIQLIDGTGKLVSQQNSTESQVKINVQSLARGTYFVKVVDTDNVSTQKVILQ